MILFCCFVSVLKNLFSKYMHSSGASDELRGLPIGRPTVCLIVSFPTVNIVLFKSRSTISLICWSVIIVIFSGSSINIVSTGGCYTRRRTRRS